MATPAPFPLYPGELQIFGSRPWTSTADFAEQHFTLVAGPSKGQKFKHDKAPYARWIMDLWDKPSLRMLFFAAPSQSSMKTTIAYACIAAEIYRDPCSFGIGMPDQNTLRRIFEEKLSPHWRMSPVLRAMLSQDRQAIQAEKIVTKFGACYGMYAGSDASASSITLRVLGIDEEDAYLDKHAVDRMIERTISYEDEAKVLRYSKVRGTERQSTIWQAMKQFAQVIYQIQAVCPNCQHPQVMVKERIKVPSKMHDPAKIRQSRMAWYECENCAMKWNDHHRNLAVQRGHLFTESDIAEPSAAGVVIPSWYSPSMPLYQVAADWFDALQKGTPSAMMWFDNSHSSKPYKVVTVNTPEDLVKEMILPDRPPRVVPAEAVALTLGVDSQKSSFFYVVRAWARTGESWLVDYGELATKQEVDFLAHSAVYEVAGRNDVVMGVWRGAIDIGGGRDESRKEGWSRPEEIKLMLMEMDSDILLGIKGASRKQDKIIRRSEVGVHKDVPREYQENITLYTLDTEELKDLIFLVRFNPAPENLQPMWLHAETGDDYIRQLSAEEREETDEGKVTWVQKKGANHYLDCEVYAAACAHTDWTPALQLLSGPQWEPRHKPQPAPKSSMSRGSLGRRTVNPHFRR